MKFHYHALWLSCLLPVCLVSSCKKSPNDTKWIYMPDMVDSPIAKAQRTYLDPPEGSVSRHAILYPKTPEESEQVLISPFEGSTPDGASLARGARLYGVYCQVCHGPEAKGNGTIVDKFPTAPDLTSPSYQTRKDGFFFHRATFGTALMPGYGHATSAKERWDIVAHLRQLQKAEPR